MSEPILNVRDNPSLEPFIRDHNLKFISYLMAYRYRRGRARNAAMQYGVGATYDPSYLSGADRDLFERYNHLMKLMELDAKSSAIYAALVDKKLQAELIIDNLREPENLDYDQRRELLLELTQLEDEIENLTGQLEDLDNA